MPNEGPRFRTLQDYKQHYGGLQELDCGAGGDCFYYCCAAAQNALIWQGFGDCEEPKKAAMMHMRQSIHAWLRHNEPSFEDSNQAPLLETLLNHGSTQLFSSLQSNRMTLLQGEPLAADLEDVNYFKEYLDNVQDEVRQAELKGLYGVIQAAPSVDADSVQQQRIRMVEKMLKNPPCPSRNVAAVIWSCFLDSILQQGCWNEELALLAVACLFGRTIQVVKVDKNNNFVMTQEFEPPADEVDPGQPVIHLLNRHDTHWVLLLPPDQCLADPPRAAPARTDLEGRQPSGISDSAVPIERWPPAVMSSATDRLTQTIKEHFGIEGVYPAACSTGLGGQQRYIDSTRVVRVTADPQQHSSRIAGSTKVTSLPLSYTHWWLFWAAVYAHRRVFPEEFTDEMIEEKFAAALQANPAEAQQYTVQDYLATRACFEENPRWRADLDRVVFTARPGASAETKGVSFSQSDKHATDKGGLQSQAKQSQPKEKVPSAPQAVFISSDSEDDSSGDSVKIMHVRTPSQNELHPPFAANQDYDGMIINNPLWTASEPAYRGLFDPDDFRVAVKVPGGPDRLKLLIRQSLATGSIEELRRAERRHNTGQPPAAGLQASAARRETQVLLANIKQQLQARLDCQQQEWQAPMRPTFLECSSNNPIVHFTGLPGCTVTATKDIKAWTFLDLYTGRIADVTTQSRTGRHHLVVWEHNNVKFAVDGARGNLTAEINDTVKLEMTLKQVAPQVSARSSRSGASSSRAQESRKLIAQTTGFRRDNIQFASARDMYTGMIYLFLITTKDVKKDEELLLDYDIGPLKAPQWYQDLHLSPVEQLYLSNTYRTRHDRTHLWNSVMAQFDELRTVLAKYADPAGSCSRRATAYVRPEAPGELVDGGSVRLLMQLEEAQRRLPVTMQRMRRLIAIRASGTAPTEEASKHNLSTSSSTSSSGDSGTSHRQQQQQPPAEQDDKTTDISVDELKLVILTRAADLGLPTERTREVMTFVCQIVCQKAQTIKTAKQRDGYMKVAVKTVQSCFDSLIRVSEASSRRQTADQKVQQLLGLLVDALTDDS